MHQHVVAGLDFGSHDEPRVACRSGHKQSRRIRKGPAFGDGEELGLSGRNLGRVGALATSEYLGPNRVLGVGRIRRSSQDNAGELGARNPWECCRESVAASRPAKEVPSGAYEAGSGISPESGEYRRNWLRWRESRSGTDLAEAWALRAR